MNYIQEINAFYDWLETNPISDTAIALWHTLMHVNNKAGWITEFAVAISTLEAKSGMKKDAVLRARNRLQQVGRITFQSRNGQQSAIYTIIPFDCVVLTGANRAQTERKPSAKRNTNRAQTASINKLNKTKKNIPKDDPAKIQYAVKVMLTPEEYQKLIGKFGEAETAERIERLSLYKQSTGKKYDSDYATILNWARKDEKENEGKGGRKGNEYYDSWGE